MSIFGARAIEKIDLRSVLRSMNLDAVRGPSESAGAPHLQIKEIVGVRPARCIAMSARTRRPTNRFGRKPASRLMVQVDASCDRKQIASRETRDK